MIEIQYNPQWFESGYYVYVLIVRHIKKDKQVYYIGQTGDRKHISARSPFYRMTGHFNTYGYKNTSTDSQLVGGLVSKEWIETPSEKKHARLCMEEAISKGEIRIVARFFKVKEFDGTEHTPKRRFTEAVEQSLITMFLKSFGEEQVMNKKHLSNGSGLTNETKAKAKGIFEELLKG